MFVETFKPYLGNINKAVDNYLRSLHFHSRGEPMLSQFQKAVQCLKLIVKPEDLVFENENLHVQSFNQIKIFPNVPIVLQELKNTNKVLSICTNRQLKSLNGILDTNQITHFFTQIVSCADLGHEKPDPHCLVNLIKHFGFSKDNFIYVGDSDTDKLFAQNAGVDFLLAPL